MTDPSLPSNDSAAHTLSRADLHHLRNALCALRFVLSEQAATHSVDPADVEDSLDALARIESIVLPDGNGQ